MMNNRDFLEILTDSFNKFLTTGSRSNEKLKILHGAIAKDLHERIGNNYFENMLGETANIRSNHIPYFQIFIIPDKIPYYDKKGYIKKWETFTDHNVKKYKVLSRDNIELAAHTPDKTLLYVIHLPDIPEQTHDRNGYIEEYQDMEGALVCESIADYGRFSPTVIFNDYETFITKVVYRILSL